MPLKRFGYVSLFFTLFLAVTTTQAAPKKTVKQKGIEKTMKQEEDIPKPILGQRKMMEKLLEMIKTSNSIKDFTPERLGQVFGVPIEKGSSGYGYGEQLTKDWRQGFAISEIETPRHMRFEIGVYPDSSALFKNLDIGETCEMNYNEFINRVVELGFSGNLPRDLERISGRKNMYNEDSLIGSDPIRSIYLGNGRLNLEISRMQKKLSTFKPDMYCIHTIWIS